MHRIYLHRSTQAIPITGKIYQSFNRTNNSNRTASRNKAKIIVEYGFTNTTECGASCAPHQGLSAGNKRERERVGSYTKSLSMWYNKVKCMWKGMKISNGTSNHTSGLT